MKTTPLLSVVLTLCSVAVVPAQPKPVNSDLASCRWLYTNWDGLMSARDPMFAEKPEEAFKEREKVFREMGWCLQALENDVLWVKTKLEENLGTGLERQLALDLSGFQEKVFSAQRALIQVTHPSWQEITLGGGAIGSPITYQQTKDYALDAAAVVKKLDAVAKQFTPGLAKRIDQVKALFGLQVEPRDCRELFVLDQNGGSTNQASIGIVADDGVVRPPPRVRKGFCLQALRNDIEALEKHLRTLDSPPRKLKSGDISSWPEPSLKGQAIGAVESVERDIDRYLIDSQIVRQEWKPIERTYAPDLSNVITSAMGYRGLRNLLSLLFEPAAVVLDIGNDGAEEFQTADTKAESFASAALALESDHFGADGSPYLHFSFGGQLAARPVMNLLREDPEKMTSTASGNGETMTPAADSMESTESMDGPEPIYPTFQQALVWDLGGRINSAYKRVEFSGGYFVGQSFLTDDKSLVKQKEDFVGVALDNQTSRAELFQELFFEVRAYDVDYRIIHGESGYLNPRFHFAYGQRWNNRYRPPEGATEERADWQRSQFVRFKWNIRNTIVSRDRYDKPLSVTFSVGVEHEWWKRSVGLPSVTAIYFTGDFDIGKIFKGDK